MLQVFKNLHKGNSIISKGMKSYALVFPETQIH